MNVISVSYYFPSLFINHKHCSCYSIHIKKHFTIFSTVWTIKLIKRQQFRTLCKTFSRQASKMSKLNTCWWWCSFSSPTDEGRRGRGRAQVMMRDEDVSLCTDIPPSPSLTFSWLSQLICISQLETEILSVSSMSPTASSANLCVIIFYTPLFLGHKCVSANVP